MKQIQKVKKKNYLKGKKRVTVSKFRKEEKTIKRNPRVIRDKSRKGEHLSDRWDFCTLLLANQDHSAPIISNQHAAHISTHLRSASSTQHRGSKHFDLPRILWFTGSGSWAFIHLLPSNCLFLVSWAMTKPCDFLLCRPDPQVPERGLRHRKNETSPGVTSPPSTTESWQEHRNRMNKWVLIFVGNSISDSVLTNNSVPTSASVPITNCRM